MGANQQYTRIDILELKSILYQKIGQQRADKYFNLLNKLFTLEISKNNFDKFCIRTIGRENLPLHNRLISSIIKNAAFAKIPPPTVKKLANSLNVKLPWVPVPQRSRSSRDRRVKDRFSPLGPNGSKGHHEVHQSPTELHSLGSRPPVEVVSVEDGEEVISVSPGIQSRSPVTAPLGISMQMSPARKTLHHSSGLRAWPRTCENGFELPSSRDLRSRMKQQLEGEGVSVSEECANLVNVALDSYLKRLIEPVIGFARSRTRQPAPGYNQTLTHGSSPRIPTVSVLDFNLAMACDPSKLGGEAWSTQYEKLCFSSFRS